MVSRGNDSGFWSSKKRQSANSSPTTSNAIPKGNSFDCEKREEMVEAQIFERCAQSSSRAERFRTLLDSPNVDLEKLRSLAWSGISPEIRPQTWKILLGYLPTNKERRECTVERKRQEYLSFVPEYERARDQYPDGDPNEGAIYHQIHIDVPRTNPSCSLFQNEIVQKSLESILYVWAYRHPASGYVQGINDLATPFFVVFLSEYISEENIQACRMETISTENLRKVEADCFWCMTKLLDSIQENYTFAQPGIQKMIFKLQGLTIKIDSSLAEHLENQEAHFIQFAFRWMNCLLMREIPLRLIVRIWDTYLSEAEEFSVFHVYVCAAFLVQWSDTLCNLEFQDLMKFLQHLPTTNWGNKEVEMLLSQAFLYKSLYKDAPSHLR